MTSSSASYGLPSSSTTQPTAPAAVVMPREPRRYFRDAIREISPPWLRRKHARAVLESIGAQLDDLTDRILAGVRARFPGVQSDALPLLGRDRRISRGRTESDGVYASRLARWLDDHRRRGGPYALLAQLHAHYAPAAFPIELRYVSGRRFQLDPATGAVTRGDVAWSPPGGTTRWARWWLFYTWPDDVHTDGTWGDPGTWGDGGVWGSDLTAIEVRDLRLIPREWGAAHARGRIRLISPAETVEISVDPS